MFSLDACAAAAAQDMVEATMGEDKGQVEGLATKALGVLQENGVYAVILFLHCRTNQAEKAIAAVIRRGLLALAPEVLPGLTPPADEAQLALGYISQYIADDLEALLLIKQVWEQALIYLRYGAKARGE